MEQFLELSKLAINMKNKENTVHETNITEGEKVAREFVLDALLSLIHDGKADCELTIKYYATKIIRYVRNTFAREFWAQFKLGDNPEYQDYYKGLVHFSQWFQPLTRICITSVKFDVECIAISSVEHLYTKHPQHTLFDAEKFTARNTTNTILNTKHNVEPFRKYLFPVMTLHQESEFNAKETFQLLDALNHVMFEEKGFRANTSNYYNPNNSFIDKVLETRQGIQITLCVLYALIAERLGIALDPINFPRHFLLRLKMDDKDRTYIDVFQKGKRLTEAEVKDMDEENTTEYHVAKPIEVSCKRILRSIINWYKFRPLE